MRRAAPLLAALALASAACGGRPETRAPAPVAVHELAPDRNEVQARRGRVLGPDAEGCTWVEGEAAVVFGEQDTVHQAHAAALEQARAAAVQDLLGADVSSKFMDFQQEGLRHDARLTESILQTTRNGRVIKEKILAEGPRGVEGVCPACRYGLKMQACVLPRDAKADKDFRVELSLSRTRFVAGDEATLKVTATRDCSIYLYDVFDLGTKDKTALVVPGEAVAEKRLRAGETWEYPDADARRSGVKLQAQLGDGADVSAETIRVVATKVPLSKDVYDPADGGYLGVLRRLNRARTEWAEDAEAYTIYKR